jgi:hypothetical protein
VAKAKKSTGRPKKSRARAKPSAPRRKPAGARRPRAAARAPQARTPTGDSVEFACAAATNDYPEAPAGLIQILDGISAINAGIARGRIVITVIPED